MQKLLPELYGIYGRYINEFRSFPFILDGCKLVERRLLLSTYEVAPKKFVKSAGVIGHAIKEYHPHGECISVNTEIPLLDGTIKTIGWLAENWADKEFWVYSCKPNGTIVPGLAHHPRITKTSKIKYRITLDNGKHDDFTENHPFMAREGHYIKAKDLKEGDSLMPLKLSEDDGYVLCSSGNGMKKTSVIVAENLYDYDSSKHHVHHIDSNRNNDVPSNIKVLTPNEHASITSKNNWKSADFRNDMSIKLTKAWTPELKEKQSKKIKQKYISDLSFRKSALFGLEKGRNEMFSSGGKFRKKIQEKNSKLITKVNKDLPKIKIMRILNDMIYNKIEINSTNYGLQRSSDKYYNYVKWERIPYYFGSHVEAIKQSQDYNHKVVKVEKIELDESENFYDISVDKWNNFGLASGIFVHNSCYEVLVRLVNNGHLDDTQGNWGLKLGIMKEKPAAMRYTETRMTPHMSKMAFEYINYIERQELEYYPEPPLIPIKFPLCLLGNEYTQGIGFGYRTMIPAYSYKDLTKRLEWLLGYRKTEPIIRPLTKCTHLSKDAEFKELLTTGKGKLLFKGKYEVDGKSVIIRNWPESKQWSAIEKKFQKDIEVEKSIGITDETNLKNGCQIRLLIKRQRGYPISKLTERLEELLVGPITFECNMVNVKGKVQLVSPDEMLITTYNIYKKVVESVLQSQIEDLTKTINELNIIKTIRPHLSVELKKNPDDLPLVINNISVAAKVEEEVLKALFEKYTIARLFRIKTETDTHALKRKELQDNLKNSADYIWANKYK